MTVDRCFHVRCGMKKHCEIEVCSHAIDECITPPLGSCAIVSDCFVDALQRTETYAGEYAGLVGLCCGLVGLYLSGEFGESAS